jgi:hypothetical protein
MAAPWWVRVLTGVGVVACGVLIIWAQSLDPILGFPVTHPAARVFLALFGLAGLGVAVWPRGWWRPSLADLPEGVKQLADRGEKVGAALVLREQTGLGLSEANQAVEAYLAGRKPDA